MDADPVKLYEEARKAQETAAKDAAKYARLTRRLLNTDTGREWLTLTMGRMNFMGSVFDESFQTGPAAYQDGKRSVISDILNLIAEAKPLGDEDE